MQPRKWKDSVSFYWILNSFLLSLQWQKFNHFLQVPCLRGNAVWNCLEFEISWKFIWFGIIFQRLSTSVILLKVEVSQSNAVSMEIIFELFELVCRRKCLWSLWNANQTSQFYEFWNICLERNRKIAPNAGEQEWCEFRSKCQNLITKYR